MQLMLQAHDWDVAASGGQAGDPDVQVCMHMSSFFPTCVSSLPSWRAYTQRLVDDARGHTCLVPSFHLYNTYIIKHKHRWCWASSTTSRTTTTPPPPPSTRPSRSAPVTTPCGTRYNPMETGKVLEAGLARSDSSSLVCVCVCVSASLTITRPINLHINENSSAPPWRTASGARRRCRPTNGERTVTCDVIGEEEKKGRRRGGGKSVRCPPPMH